MEENGLGNCWDYFRCDREDREQCPAFKEKAGTHCWDAAIMETKIINSGVGTFDDLKRCWECEFYRKSKGLDT